MKASVILYVCLFVRHIASRLCIRHCKESPRDPTEIKNGNKDFVIKKPIIIEARNFRRF